MLSIQLYEFLQNIKLCNSHPYKNISRTIPSLESSLISLSSQSLSTQEANTILTITIICFVYCKILREWNHITAALSCLAIFIQYNVF